MGGLTVPGITPGIGALFADAGTGYAGGPGLLDKLFGNKSFLQILSAAGSDLLANTPGKNINAANQQLIASPNYAKLLAQMLGGNVPEGGKISLDSTGMKIQVPNLAGTTSAGTSIAGQATTQPSQSPSLSLEDIGRAIGSIVPFPGSQPLANIKASDLAGVSPELLATAVQLGQTQQQIGQKSVSELIDLIYKRGLLDYYQGQLAQGQQGLGLRAGELDVHRQRAITDAVAEFRKWEENALPAPISIPGLGTITGKQFSALDPGTKAYGYYAHNARLMGEDVMSLKDFKDFARTSQEKNYDRAVEGGYEGSFDTWLLRNLKTGGTHINLNPEKIEFKKMSGDIAGQLYFTNPEGLEADLTNYLGSTEFTKKMFLESPENRAEFRKKETVKFIENRITSSGGEILDTQMAKDGKTRVWLIKWLSGDRTVFRHGIEP